MKQAKKLLGAKLLSATKTAAEKALVNSANSTSCIIVHQPKAPKGLSKFRKF